MTVAVSMLRGVNVGGHNMIKMDALRSLCESLGCSAAQTYIQSGNVIFRAKEREIAAMEKRIAGGIQKTFGIRCGVMVRTLAELRDALDRNPFASRADIDPKKLLFLFLAGSPTAEAQSKVLQIKAEPEELRVSGREVYIYYANGMARPKLPLTLVEKSLAMPATGRNWNTVRKLAEIATQLS